MFNCSTCHCSFGDKAGLKDHLNRFPGCRTVRTNSVALTAAPPAGQRAVTAGVVAVPNSVFGFSGRKVVTTTTTTLVAAAAPEVLKVTKEVSSAMDITFLLDMSGSMSGAPAAQMEAQLINFIGAPVVKNNDTVQVVGFDTNHVELLRCTKKKDLSREQIQALGISQLSGFGGGTRLWDAISYCTDLRRQFIDARKATKPGFSPKPYIMLVLSDGEDGSSHEDLKRRLQHPGVPDFHIHLIGIGNDGSFAGMKSLSQGCGHIEFTHVRLGSHRGVETAMEDVFRNKFVATVQRQRNVLVTRTTTTTTTTTATQQEGTAGAAGGSRGAKSIHNSNSSNNSSSNSSGVHRHHQRSFFQQLTPPPPPPPAAAAAVGGGRGSSRSRDVNHPPNHHPNHPNHHQHFSLLYPGGGR